MALDHYVSQVHLKGFYSPILRNRMFALRKRDLKAFTPDAYSVCRIDEGNTNSYLREPRLIEVFLKGIEPKYNDALSRLEGNSFDLGCIYVLSGFIAYVQTCSPTAMRVHSQPLRSIVEETGRFLDRMGKFEPPPAVLGGSSFTELLDKKALHVAIDPKYPQAVGIENILDLTNSLGNFTWEVLVNRYDDSPYFTSDYPAAIETTTHPIIKNTIVPLSPRIALRIIPNREAKRCRTDFTFPNFQRRVHNLSRDEVRRINRLIVRCAEEVVFYRDDHEWVNTFVSKNATYRIEPQTQQIMHSREKLTITSLAGC